MSYDLKVIKDFLKTDLHIANTTDNIAWFLSLFWLIFGQTTYFVDYNYRSL